MSDHSTGARRDVGAFRAPSGAVVRIRSGSADLSEEWFAWAELIPNGQASSPRAAAGERRGFMVGPRSAVRAAVDGVLQGSIRETVRFAGGDFVIADGSDEVFGAWTGPWHAVYGWFPPHSLSTTILGTFTGVAFVDDPLGVRITSRSERFGRVMVTKRVPNVGLMQILQRREASGLLPSWPGAPVAAGEVWRKQVSDGQEASPHEHLVFASTSAVAIMEADPDMLRFEPAARSTPPDEADRLVLRFLEDLTELSWGSE